MLFSRAWKFVANSCCFRVICLGWRKTKAEKWKVICGVSWWRFVRWGCLDPGDERRALAALWLWEVCALLSSAPAAGRAPHASSEQRWMHRELNHKALGSGEALTGRRWKAGGAACRAAWCCTGRAAPLSAMLKKMQITTTWGVRTSRAFC